MILNKNSIESLIPHRDPFLFLDKCEIIEIGFKGVGYKVFRNNEYFFQGHFPNQPIVPGVILIEAMAQTAAVFVIHGLKEDNENRLVYFMSIESARFRKPVIPGDTLRINVFKKQSRGNVWKFDGEAYVEENLVAESTFSAMIANQ